MTTRHLMQVDLKQHYDNADFSITVQLLHEQFTSVALVLVQSKEF